MTFDNILWLDLETRSRVDLKAHGAYRYAACPDHRILVAGWALGKGRPEAAIIKPGRSGLPLKLRNMLADKRLQVRAHNAAFDRLQLKGDAPPIERWYCTAAQARAIALPGKLEDLGRAVGAKIRKDPRGQELIKLLTMPQADGSFNDNPYLMQEFADYCAQDIGTMRACSLMMPDMRDEDVAVYHAGERVNDRGLPIDRELCELAVRYADAEKIEAAARVIELSDGVLRTVRGTKLTKWVYERLDPALRRHMDVYRSGRKSMTLAVDIRANLLAIAEEEPGAIDPVVVEMIEAAEAGAMSSTSKFQTMLNRVSDDGRLRGAFVFNGAYQTNRWSSTGAQLHNFPRLVAEDPEAILTLMRRGQCLPGVLRTLKSMLRPAITPGRGRLVVRGDWNAIEARGLPWLVDTPAAREYMRAFSDPKRDIYIEQALAAGLGPVRQPGKVVVLSLGYGGAAGALVNMARNYGVSIEEPDGVVARWRRANAWVSHKKHGWWAMLQRAAMNAMCAPGRSYSAGRVSFEKQGANLTMLLPSGRRLHYPMAEVVEGPYGAEIEYLKASWKPKADAKEWPRARLWHGVMAENADQAVCADLLRETLVRAEGEGLAVTGHVHDEVITESDTRTAKSQGRALSRCMVVLPAWADNFPLKAEVDIAPRFRK